MQVYLAKAPDSIPLSEWDGDGDYFKIAYAGPLGDMDWKLVIEGQRRINVNYTFPIPKTTPPGRYLMRIEHIYPHEKNETQLWANCAQINIIGEGGGKFMILDSPMGGKWRSADRFCDCRQADGICEVSGDLSDGRSGY